MVTPCPAQPAGAGGGGGSGGKAVGLSGPLYVGENWLVESSELGEWHVLLTVPEFVRGKPDCPPPPPVAEAGMSPAEAGYIMLMSGTESGEVFEN